MRLKCLVIPVFALCAIMTIGFCWAVHWYVLSRPQPHETLPRQAYVQGWVGFPELNTSDCVEALTGPVLNSMFPSIVRRVEPATYIVDSANCSAFIRKYGFGRHPPATQEELAFPLAFAILFHKDFDQVMFMLRAIYHEHNVYCLTVDLKAGQEFIAATRAVARCLPNVFVARTLVDVVYAGFSRLQADLICMRDLLEHPIKWQYVLNLPGQQFPLLSNLEMVRVIKSYNGFNDIQGTREKGQIQEVRYKFKFVKWWDSKNKFYTMIQTNETYPPPPHQLNITKGANYGTFSRAFVHFLLTSKISQDFQDWLTEVYSPDEFFWATLNYANNLGLVVPGGSSDPPENHTWQASYSIWDVDKVPCATKYVRQVCILSPEDMQGVLRREALFANKFYIDHHPAALHCLDQLIFNMTITGMTRDLSSYFKQTLN